MMGASGGAAAFGGGKGPEQAPRGGHDARGTPGGVLGGGPQGPRSSEIYIYIYVLPTSKVHQRYISRPGGWAHRGFAS